MEVVKLKIYGDSPTIEDSLGFDKYAKVLLDLIKDFDGKTPLTIGIHGSWGSGKTSLMKMLEMRLKNETDDRFKLIWFNAWAYGGDEPIGLALLHQILIEFEKEKKQGKINTLFESTSKLLTDVALRNTVGIPYNEAKNHFKSGIEIKSTLRADFETSINECLKGRSLVVFIDDLDRCLPEKTIEIIEVIKIFLDVPKCIYVIGVAKEVIEQVIEVRYKSKGQKISNIGKDYMEKIIQIPFTLPPIKEENMEKYINGLNIAGKEKGYVKIVSKSSESNPRKVKMFLNTLRVRQSIAKIAGLNINTELFAKFFVIEYVFPELFRDVVKYKGQNILYKLEKLMQENPDEELLTVLKNSKILKKYHEDEDLSNLLNDEPFFNNLDIDPYIYLSEIEVTDSYEKTHFNEYYIEELMSGDYIRQVNAVENIKRNPYSDKQKIRRHFIVELENKDDFVCANAKKVLRLISDAKTLDELDKTLEEENVLKNTYEKY